MKRVAVTGITGTFGREFLRAALTVDTIERVVGVSRDELKQAELADEYKNEAALRLFLGDVRDYARLQDAFFHCDTVVHAAALKRVDAVAYNPSEVNKTNVLGTENVIRAALAAGVGRVLVISSDKAVAPANIYGASKAMAEHIAVQSNTYAYPQGTRVSVLRYGNVLGSRGSVLHRWRQQVARNEPITITDARMARFMLTIRQAVDYALRAIDLMEGGEIFIPKLPTARMVDLALAVAGSESYSWVETGLRPGGEKLAEALISDEEAVRTVDCGLFYLIIPHACTWRVQSPPSWSGAQMPETFRYVSDGHLGLMTVQELGAMLELVR